MTKVGAGGRLRRASSRLVASRWTVVVFILGGLALRLILARGNGAFFDVGYWRSWGHAIHEFGPGHAYARSPLPIDYPPGILYVIWALEELQLALTGTHLGPFTARLPAVFGDLALALVAGVLARAVMPIERQRIAQLMAVAFIMFNPLFILDSASWGQFDSLGLACVCGGLAMLLKRNYLRDLLAVFLLTCGLLVKAWTAAYALPVFLLVILIRYRHSIATSGITRPALKLAGLAVPSVGWMMVVGLPFGVSVQSLPTFFQWGVDRYPYTSHFGFNFWALTGWYVEDSARIVGPLTMRALGVVMFLLSVGAVVYYCQRAIQRGRQDVSVALLGSAAIASFGFVLMTRAHGRYAIYGIAFLTAFICSRVAPLLIGSSLVPALNLHFIYWLANMAGDGWGAFQLSIAPPDRTNAQPVSLGVESWLFSDPGIAVLNIVNGFVVLLLGIAALALLREPKIERRSRGRWTA